MKIKEVNHGQMFQPDFKAKKQKKKTENRLSWIKSSVLIVLIISIIVSLAISPFFNIKSIKVQGSVHYREEDIIDISGIMNGTNGFKAVAYNAENIKAIGKLLYLRCIKAEESILKNHAYIKDASVRFAIPDKVVIDLTERKPVGVIPYMGANLLIDSEGYVLDTIEKAESSNLPLIIGLEFNGYEIGQALKLKDEDNLKTVNNIIQVLAENEKDDKLKLSGLINSFDISDLNKVRLMLDSRIVVDLGDLGSINEESLLYRLNFLKQIFFKNIKKEDKGLIDFTMGENPKFIPGN